MRHFTLSTVLFGLASLVATSTVSAESSRLNNVDASAVMGRGKIMRHSLALEEMATLTQIGGNSNIFVVNTLNCANTKANPTDRGWSLRCGEGENASTPFMLIDKRDALFMAYIGHCAENMTCLMFQLVPHKHHREDTTEE